MSEERGLYQAVLDNPDDDAIRLVYADWLEEHGDEEDRARAEFIRVQIALHQAEDGGPQRRDLLVREKFLAPQKERWRQSLADLKLDEVRVRRGFPDGVGTSGGQLLEVGEELLRRFPVTEASVKTSPGRLFRLLDAPLLDRVRRLEVRMQDWPTRAAETLIVSRHLPRVHRLSLDGERTDFRALDLLLRGLRRSGVRRMSFHRFRREAIFALGGSGLLGRLRDLGLFSCDVPTSELRDLVRDPDCGGLRSFDTTSVSVGTAGAYEIAQSPRLTNLRYLCLAFDRQGIGDSGAGYLASSPHLRLLGLSLPRNHITELGAAAIASSPHLADLNSLNLSLNEIGGRGVRALAESERLGSLTELFLSQVGVGDEGLEALARSENLRHLLRLDLSGHDFTEGQVRILARLPLGPQTDLVVDAGPGVGLLLERFGSRVVVR